MTGRRYGMRASTIRYLQTFADGRARNRGYTRTVRALAANVLVYMDGDSRTIGHMVIALAMLAPGNYVRMVLDGRVDPTR